MLCFSAAPTSTLRESMAPRDECRAPRAGWATRPVAGSSPLNTKAASGMPRRRAEFLDRKTSPRRGRPGALPTDFRGPHAGRFQGPARGPWKSCAKVAWALQPFDNVHATDLQEGDLLEWLLLLNTRNDSDQNVAPGDKAHRSDGANERG